MANDDHPEAEAAGHDRKPEDAAVEKKHKEEKPKSTLESVIGELTSFTKKAVAIGLLAAMPFTYNYIDPSHVARAAVTTGAFAASKVTTNIIQEKDAFNGIVRNGFNGALLSYPIAEGFKGLNSLESAIQLWYSCGQDSKSSRNGIWIAANYHSWKCSIKLRAGKKIQGKIMANS